MIISVDIRELGTIKYMSNIQKLKDMMNTPSGKDFHKKFGLPKGIKNHPSKKKALDKAKSYKDEKTGLSYVSEGAYKDRYIPRRG